MQSRNLMAFGRMIHLRRGVAPFGTAVWLVGFAILGGLTLAPWTANQEVVEQVVQEQDDPPPRGAVEGGSEEEVEAEEDLPRGIRGIGRLRGPRQFQFNQQFGNGAGGVSFSRSSSNGVTTTVMKEGDQEVKLEETPDGIFIEIGRSYTRNDVDQLKSSHPELAKALEAFPTIADGNEVELSVRAVKKYEAVNEDDLKEEHPEAYEQYQRLVQMGQGGFESGIDDLFGAEDFGLQGIQELEAHHERMRREMQKMLERIR
ncbi:MAG: hypothetical protein JNL67_03340 [Planctomycetaceae bacterium]|nr:hypothetical protein [Planctomycetaceae bacterium]